MKALRVGAVLVALAVAGCGGGGTAAPASTSSTTTSVTSSAATTTAASAGPVAFLAWAHQAQMGDRDLASATDDQLLGLGNAGCEVIKTAPSFGSAVEELGKSLKDMGATTPQVEDMLRKSVLNLCPQYSGLVP